MKRRSPLALPAYPFLAFSRFPLSLADWLAAQVDVIAAAGLHLFSSALVVTPAPSPTIIADTTDTQSFLFDREHLLMA